MPTRTRHRHLRSTACTRARSRRRRVYEFAETADDMSPRLRYHAEQRPRPRHPARCAPHPPCAGRATRCFAVCRRPPWEPHGAEPSLAEPRAFPVPACAFVTRQLVSSQRPRAFPCLGGVQLTRHTPNGALAASQVLRLWTELLQASVGRFLRGHEFSARLNKYQQ